MAGQGSLKRDLGRGPVANLADGDDFRILAQQGAETALESQTGRQVDLRLGHARHGCLDRVFQGGQAALAAGASGQLAQASVE